MTQRDSFDKVVESYFSAITREVFVYKDKWFHPKPLKVSPLIFRGFTCPEQCGGCCPRFSLDYLPIEDTKDLELEPRVVFINSKAFSLLSDMQDDHQNHHCRNLLENGRCGIYKVRPFSCDFELIRFMHFSENSVLTQKLFGRGWSMLRVDDKRGAKCEMLPITKESTKEVVRKLYRLKQWVDYFEIKTCINKIIQWAQTGPHLNQLYIGV
jgi:Fe-S-cluster containining protein